MKFLKEENEHLWNLFLEAPTNCSINHDSILNGMKSFTEEQIKSMLKSYPSILDIGSISVIELLQKKENEMVTLFIDTVNYEIVGRYNYKILPEHRGISVKLNYIDPNSNFRGITKRFLVDYLIPKYKIVYSDSLMTEDGLVFWIKMYRDFNDDLVFMVVAHGKYLLIDDPSDFLSYYELNDKDIIFMMATRKKSTPTITAK